MIAFPQDPPPGAKLAPAARRNREAILAALAPWLPDTGLVLEIAAGSGEHAVSFASALPRLQWLPTDWDEAALSSIATWRAWAGLANLLEPQRLDAAQPASWAVERADALVAVNMIHISPWTATQGLMSGAARLLPIGGLLYLYGPYLDPAVETASSNLAFDDSLKARDPTWGLRRVEDVATLADANGLTLAERIEMPANNLSLILRRR